MENDEKEFISSEDNKNNDLYTIPKIFKSGFNLKTNLMYILLIAFITSPIYLHYGDSMRFSLKILSAFLGLIFLIFWLYIGIFKRITLSLTTDGIKFKFIKTKLVCWTDIKDVQVFTQNKNKMLGIISKQQPSLNNVRSVKNTDSPYNIVIPLSFFPKIDSDRLYNTICYISKNSI